MYIQEVIIKYHNYLLYEKQVSKETFSGYTRAVNEFFEVCLKRKVQTIEDIDKPLIIAWRLQLRKRNLKPISIAKKITSVRSFFNFLKIKYDYTAISIIAPKFGRKLPEYLNKEQVVQVINYLDKDKTEVGIRNHLLIKFIYSTGIRVSELINIKLVDINLTERSLLVNGKGEKQRLIAFPTILVSEITHYITKVRPKLSKGLSCEYLFFNNGTDKFTRVGVWYIFKGIGKDLGIKFYPHKLRHSIATHLLQNGVNLKIIKNLLGHEHINTTEIYTHLDKDHLREEYDKHHPRR